MSEMKFKVNFGKARHRQTSQKPVPGFVVTDEASTPSTLASAGQPRRVGRTARLLALAYYVEREIEAGRIKSYAEVAGRLGVSRARLSQIANMVLLPVAVQEAILSGQVTVSERELRKGALVVLSQARTSQSILAIPAAAVDHRRHETRSGK
jgi:transcriptional regulator with XRE-family HTH domain